MPRMRVTDILCCTYNIVPVRDVVDLRSPASPKLQRGNTGVLHQACLRFGDVVYRCCCCTAAVENQPCPYCAGANQIQRKYSLMLSRLCSGWHTPTHAHTEAPLVVSRKGYLIPSQCDCCIAIPVEKENAYKRDGVIQTLRRSRQQTAQQERNT